MTPFFLCSEKFHKFVLLMRKILFFIPFLLCASVSVNAATIEDTLYIHRDTATMGEFLVNRCVLNNTSVFDKRNGFIDIAVGDDLDITIINTDTLAHSLSVSNITALGTVNAGDTVTFSHQFNDFGTYGIGISSSLGYQLGAQATVRVGITGSAFIWNLWEMNDTLSLDLGDGIVSSIPTAYFPNVSTINGEVYPETASDPMANIAGSVGDSLYISIVNSGNIVHTMHFHGYHVKILQATQETDVVDWIKDSPVVRPRETMTLLLVPDKPGMYPVHDHNLVSVLTQNTYGGGMIALISILP